MAVLQRGLVRVRRGGGTDATRAAGLVPFALLTAAALGSIWLPPDPQHPLWVAAAAGAGVLIFIERALRLSGETHLARAARGLAAIAAIALLFAGAGGTTGLAGLALLPVIYSVLYDDPVDTALLLPAVAVVLLVNWVVSGAPPVVLVRTLCVFEGIALLLCVAVHELRRRLETSAAAAQEHARLLGVMADATTALAASLNPGDVKETAAHLTAILASPRTGFRRRGAYVDVADGVCTIAADSDEEGFTTAGTAFALADHPVIDEVVRSGRTVSRSLVLGEYGPRLRPVMAGIGMVHGAWAPVSAAGRVVGVLAATSRDKAFPPELSARLESLAEITGLAMSNALTHKSAADQAVIDPLTGAWNRRGLDLRFAAWKGNADFTVLAVDVDHLKQVNDEFGHTQGDRVIRAVAGALTTAAGDEGMVARIGGDEFLCLTPAVSPDDVDRMVARLHDVLTAVRLESGPVEVSVGNARHRTGETMWETYRRADAEMYEQRTRVRGGRAGR